jgi:glycosyltransferase involved in cell wall biosynthesis
MDAAIRLRSYKDIHFVIVGNGRKFKWVESFVQNHSLEEQVHLLGRYPSETMPLLFSKADVMLVTLKDASIFNLTVPAKLQAYMSAGKPIVAMMNGEGPRVIEEAQCGWSVVAGDDKGLAKCILEISSFDEEILLNKGSNGRRYQIDNFSVDKCLLALERMME